MTVGGAMVTGHFNFVLIVKQIFGTTLHTNAVTAAIFFHPMPTSCLRWAKLTSMGEDHTSQNNKTDHISKSRNVIGNISGVT